MKLGRRKSVCIKLNIDELYVLSERIRWKLKMFLGLNSYAYKNDNYIKSKIRLYFRMLKKIVNLDISNPIINDIGIKLTSDEVLILWEVLGAVDREYERSITCFDEQGDVATDLIDNVIRGNISYKDLEYEQKIYIYLYAEIAICMRDSNNQNVYVEGNIIKVRNTYIYEYLSDYICIYETDVAGNFDLMRSFYVIEPRYDEFRKRKFRLKELFISGLSTLSEITLEEIRYAQDIVNAYQVDYDYLEDTENDYTFEYLDEFQEDLELAEVTLNFQNYGPGWRIHTFYNNFLDIDENEESDYYVSEKEVISRLKDYTFINLDKSIIDKNALNDIVSQRIEVINEIKSNYENLLYHPLICKINSKSKK